MRTNVTEIPHTKRDSQRNLKLDKGLRDAVADHLRHRWPCGTAKLAANAYGLSLDRAKEAVAYRCSLTTLEQIVKRGGWPVGLAILAAVIGYGIEQYISEQRVMHEERWGRFTALFGSDRGVFPVSDGGSVCVEPRRTGGRVSSRS